MIRTKSCTRWKVIYPKFYRILCIPSWCRISSISSSPPTFKHQETIAWKVKPTCNLLVPKVNYVRSSMGFTSLLSARLVVPSVSFTFNISTYVAPNLSYVVTTFTSSPSTPLPKTTAAFHSNGTNDLQVTGPLHHHGLQRLRRRTASAPLQRSSVWGRLDGEIRSFPTGESTWIPYGWVYLEYPP